jgi:hypothetical protein
VEPGPEFIFTLNAAANGNEAEVTRLLRRHDGEPQEVRPASLARWERGYLRFLGDGLDGEGFDVPRCLVSVDLETGNVELSSLEEP